MPDWLRKILSGRPWWMNLLMTFCAFMAVIYVPYDLFVKPVAEDQEVWLGFMLHSWAAKITEPVHLAIYAAGAFGFWKMRPWMWPWAAVYSGSVAIGMLLWPWLEAEGTPGMILGAIGFVLFSVPTVALARARPLFGNTSARGRA